MKWGWTDNQVTEFNELKLVEALLEEHAEHPFLKSRVLTRIHFKEFEWPVYGLIVGQGEHPERTFGVFAGVHGLEKIGTRLLLYFLDSLLQRLKWNVRLQQQLKQTRLVLIPIVNPGGMALNLRSNPDGIDLMRNADVEAQDAVPWLAGGHRLSSRLPWYRGPIDGGLCPENKALFDFVRSELFTAKMSIALDLHSGFGRRDRLWFPYAKTKKNIDRESEFLKFKTRLRETHPHHVYKVEPQSISYCTHGDVWDFLYDEHRVNHPDRLFLPWTLEMGSWLWIKKDPLKLISRLGLFNPFLEHRHCRILRRHYLLLEYCLDFCSFYNLEACKTGSY